MKLIGTFQRFAEATYAKLQGVVPARGNVFQTVGEASELWRAAIGVGYEDLLTADQLRLFTRYVQQRHVLTHSDGLVDQAYLDRSHDASYRLGQRIVVRPEDTRALADLLTDLARAVHARL